MNLTALILIFSSVVLHALWHFLCKTGNPRIGFFLVFSITIFLTMLPLMIFGGINPFRLPLNVWLCFMGGGIIGLLGNIGLSFAYRFSDISLAYPVARALPVLLTAFITAIFGFGKALTPVTYIGMTAIFAGCILMPFPGLSHFRLSAYWNRGMLGILIAAFATTGYTIVDSFGIHNINAALPDTGKLFVSGTYSCLREASVFIPMLIYLGIRKAGRKQFTKEWFIHPHPYFAGIFAGLAYLLILISMGYVTNVSYVQAFRQLSLPIGLLLGVLVLKERITWLKAGALVLILSGLSIVYLG